MPFKKGQSGNPKGRELGSKNKNYTNLSVWFEMLSTEISGLEKEKKLGYIVMAIDKILTKVPTIPATPGDSVDNASATHALMRALEREDASAATPAAGG